MRSAAAPGVSPAKAPAAEDARKFRFTYSVTVRDLPPDARHVSVWIPVPKTDPHQTVRDLDIQSPVPYRIEREAQFGNSILHFDAEAPLPRRIDLEIEAVIERRSYRVLDSGNKDARDLEPAPVPRDLQPDRLVPVDGQIATLARDVTRDARTPLEQVRAIYDYVTAALHYDKSGTGWGRGDALFACDARRGNCTDFHSLIIGMARARGIPARFVIGFPLPEERGAGEVPGYHCWAELYVKGVGWLPVDSSEANRHPEKHALFFGGLDANRVEFTTGRDLELVAGATERLNYFVYPYVEVDGKPYSGIDKRFTFADLGG